MKLSDLLEDIMTTDSVGLKPSNYVGTMTRSGGHIGGMPLMYSKDEKGKTKELGSKKNKKKKGKHSNAKPQDVLNIMKANASPFAKKVAKANNVPLIFNTQNRPVIL